MRSFVDWQNRRALVDDLETQRRAIVEQVGKADPVEALDLLWRFLALGNSIFERCDDSSGTVTGIFHHACEDLGEIAKAAKTDPTQLADRAFRALTENDYGQYDRLITVLAPALGRAGHDHLKGRMIALSHQPVRKPPEKERQVIGWRSGGPIYADETAQRSRASTVRLALQEIADVQAMLMPSSGSTTNRRGRCRRSPRPSPSDCLRRAAPKKRGRQSNRPRLDEAAGMDFEWEGARIAVLDALGRGDEAQACRWLCFERSLSAPHLRAYLKRLPDFDDVEGEKRALDNAEGHESVLQALSFLVSWPALDRAASLVIRRAAELDGDHFEFLTPAADALAGTHPLAATLVLRR